MYLLERIGIMKPAKISDLYYSMVLGISPYKLSGPQKDLWTDWYAAMSSESSDRGYFAAPMDYWCADALDEQLENC